MEHITLTTEPTEGYALIDSGNGSKLERFGDFVLERPDPQVLWKKRCNEKIWGNAASIYVRTGDKGQWQHKKEIPEAWTIPFGGLSFVIKPTSFKHTGLFPEQLPNWEWAQTKIREAGRPISVLNLFGYTGGATLAAAQAGAEVCHVDASKTAVSWAKENAVASGLSDAPIRWIVDDVRAFVEREVRREKKYDAIIMDPPAFGRGTKNEVWKIEEDLVELLALCRSLLSEKPLFTILNGYAAGYAPRTFAYMLEPIAQALGGTVVCGELTIGEEGSERALSSGIFARWYI